MLLTIINPILITSLKAGAKIRRSSWPRGKYLQCKTLPSTKKDKPLIRFCEHLNDTGIAWQPTIEDLDAYDWMVIE